MSFVKRKVFISHYKGDQVEVDDFIAGFDGVFIPKVLGANDNDDFINSSDTNYVMQRIRDQYLDDSTVTIVLLGSCTHSRRYVDWEIKSSLQQGEFLPNGLIGIVLPSGNNKAILPGRLKDNWNKEHQDCYARFKPYPSSELSLIDWIEDAYQARTARAHLISNPPDMMKNNSKCTICKVTH